MGAALFGGFVGTYLKPLKPEDVARVEIPVSEVLPEPAGGVDTGEKPPEPPFGIGHSITFPWAKEIKAIAIIPDFVVATHDARSVLPDQYARSDVVSISPFPSCDTSAPVPRHSTLWRKESRNTDLRMSRFITCRG